MMSTMLYAKIEPTVNTILFWNRFILSSQSIINRLINARKSNYNEYRNFERCKSIKIFLWSRRINKNISTMLFEKTKSNTLLSWPILGFKWFFFNKLQVELDRGARNRNKALLNKYDKMLIFFFYLHELNWRQLSIICYCMPIASLSINSYWKTRIFRRNFRLIYLHCKMLFVRRKKK